MKRNVKYIVAGVSILLLYPITGFCQETEKVWTLNSCIQYALEKNIQIQQTQLVSRKKEIAGDQAKSNRYPTLNASVNENLGWNKSVNAGTNKYGNYTGTNNTGIAVSSSVTLFNGFKLRNTIKQAETDFKASQYDTKTNEEAVSLSILNAYLQVLYSREDVMNSQKQIESTEEQLRLAGERLTLGAISQSEYLQVKSQLASEKYTLATAGNQFAIDKVTLMQLMELPVTSKFNLEYPAFGDSVNQHRNPDSESIYITALAIKPQIKSAGLNLQSAQENVTITKAGYLPQLSLTGGISSGYSSELENLAYYYQVGNNISPNVGLTLSIPIYQNNQVSNQVQTAKLDVENATLNMNNTKNVLRKAIEQACVDVVSAEKEYESSREQHTAALESYQVASEKFDQGLLSSVDFLVQKTNLIAAESNVLASKYTLIFSYKTLDFYSGIPLGF
ncbi:MAG: TolC family protein [Saccharofermentanaceae bacterium]|jgi:outer membrane protein